jgi:hypothetical protein
MPQIILALVPLSSNIRSNSKIVFFIFNFKCKSYFCLSLIIFNNMDAIIYKFSIKINKEWPKKFWSEGLFFVFISV